MRVPCDPKGQIQLSTRKELCTGVVQEGNSWLDFKTCLCLAGGEPRLWLQIASPLPRSVSLGEVIHSPEAISPEAGEDTKDKTRQVYTESA